MPITGLDHVQLAMPVGAEDAGRAFYVGLLGLAELPKPPALATRGGFWVRAGAIDVHLGVEADFRAAKKAHPCFLVADLSVLRARLAEAGYPIKDDAEIPGRARFFSEDPFGNRLEFVAFG